MLFFLFLWFSFTCPVIVFFLVCRLILFLLLQVLLRMLMMLPRLLRLIGSKFPNAVFDLLVLRNDITKIPNLTFSALLEKVQYEIQYDGGTDLSIISVKKNEGFDFMLFFSDGLSTLGNVTNSNNAHRNLGREVPKKLGVPIYTFSSDAAANFTTLKILARNSGGEFFNLNEQFSASEIVSRIGSPAYGFINAVYKDKEIGST